jgi:hypothetical protein
MYNFYVIFWNSKSEHFGTVPVLRAGGCLIFQAMELKSHPVIIFGLMNHLNNSRGNQAPGCFILLT